MAKGKGSIKGWITKNGVHIPIYGHYSVRGGEEPKAKGTKFKRRKRPEEFDKDIRETEGGKFMAQYSSDQGRKKGVKDIEKPFETREGARKFLAEENGEYEDAYPKNKSTKIKRGMTDEELDTANRELDAKDAKADMEKYEAEHPMKKGKKERNVLGQEVDFAEVDRTAKDREKDFIVDTPIPEGKAWERAESKRKAMEAADEADAYDRQHKEGKYTEAEAYQKSGQLSKDLQTSNKALDEKWQEHSKQESSVSSFSPESSAQTINDMARRRANGGGKDDDWKIANQTLESAPAGTTMIQTGNRGVKFQYTKGEDGKWHSSAGEDYTQDSKTLSMSWRGESGPGVEFTTPDKALSNADIKASHDAATSGRLNQALGLDRNNRPIGNRSTRKVDTSTPTRTEKQDSLSASMNERSRIRGELHAKDNAMKAAMPTTVSGLRSAYADATGSMKSKIAAELRRKGYSLVGGKWVKGRKE